MTMGHASKSNVFPLFKQNKDVELNMELMNINNASKEERSKSNVFPLFKQNKGVELEMELMNINNASEEERYTHGQGFKVLCKRSPSYHIFQYLDLNTLIKFSMVAKNIQENIMLFLDKFTENQLIQIYQFLSNIKLDNDWTHLTPNISKNKYFDPFTFKIVEPRIIFKPNIENNNFHYPFNFSNLNDRMITTPNIVNEKFYYPFKITILDKVHKNIILKLIYLPKLEKSILSKRPKKTPKYGETHTLINPFQRKYKIPWELESHSWEIKIIENSEEKILRKYKERNREMKNKRTKHHIREFQDHWILFLVLAFIAKEIYELFQYIRIESNLEWTVPYKWVEHRCHSYRRNMPDEHCWTPIY